MALWNSAWLKVYICRVALVKRKHLPRDSPCSLSRQATLSPRRGSRFVQNQPVESELPDSFDESVELHRLSNVAVRAQAVALQPVLILIRGRENHDRKKPRSLGRAKPPQHLESADLGQLEIEENDLRHLRYVAAGIRAFAKEVVQRLFAVPDDDDFVSDVVLLQRAKREDFIIGIVFHQQNRFFLHSNPPIKVACFLQREIDRCSAVHGSFRPNLPSVPKNHPLHRGQANAGSRELFNAVEPLERAEQAVRIGGIKTGAVVTDEVSGLPVVAKQPHLNAGFRSFRRKFPRVAEEVLQYDAQQVTVTLRQQAGSDFEVRPAFRISGAQTPRDFVRHCTQVDLLAPDFRSSNAGKLQEIINEHAHALSCATNALQAGSRFGVQLCAVVFSQDLAEPVNGAQRGTQIV